MANDKNTRDKNQPQPAQNEEKHINPFRDANSTGNEPTPEEQAAREQQLKEAMTERD